MTHFFLSLALLLLTATTASPQTDSALTSTPGPVTTITADMIESSGARNLKDVLVTYVPGMTFSQDHNEVNVAMRGVYASSQQKILVLVNGHELNSRSYVAANPDFGISLDHIARIDVIRGPASSLYGHGALAAVVSIVTRTGQEVDGTEAAVGIGSVGQVKLNGLYGGQTNAGADVLAWGSFYRSDGETVGVPADQDYSRVPSDAQAILDGFRGPPSHDVGLNLKTRAFTLFAAHRYGRYIEPFSAGGPTGESYDYHDYQAGNGLEPGFGMASFNIGVSHERMLGASTLLMRAYADRMEIAAHVISDPSIGAHSLVTWKDWDAGFVASVSAPFTAKGREGRWTAGAQVDYMRVDDSVLSTGTQGGWSNTLPRGGLLELGDEHTESGFVRVAYQFSERWSADAGLRYDHKDRHEGDSLNHVSPHVGVTYRPDDRSSVAVSFAEGLVDAPYWYRYNSLPSYQGSRNLRPEYLTSIQVTPATIIAEGLSARATVFYNDLQNLVWRNNAAIAGQPTYQNAGFLESWGIEPELRYVRQALTIDTNLTYQRVRDARNYDVTDSEVNNVPSFVWNTVVSVKPEAMAAHDLGFSVTARYIGEQRSPVNITVGAVRFFEPDRTVDQVMLIDAGVRAGRIRSSRWFFDARVFNLFDTEYEQGGSVPHPYPQAGRSALVQVGSRF